MILPVHPPPVGHQEQQQTKNICDFKGHCLKLCKFCFASLAKLFGKLLDRVTCVFTLYQWNGEPIPKTHK